MQKTEWTKEGIQNIVESRIIQGYQDFRHMFGKMFSEAKTGIEETLKEPKYAGKVRFTREEAYELADIAMGYALDVI